jgi:hypothetical protein
MAGGKDQELGLLPPPSRGFLTHFFTGSSASLLCLHFSVFLSSFVVPILSAIFSLFGGGRNCEVAVNQLESRYLGEVS